MRRTTNTLQVEIEKTRKILLKPENTLPSLIFNSVGRLICKFTKKDQIPHWIYSALVLLLIGQMPTLFISILLKENEHWFTGLGFIWMGYIGLGLSAIIIGRLGIFYLFRSLESYIIDKIRSKEDLLDLQNLLTYVWSEDNLLHKWAIYTTLVITVFWSISFSWVYSIYLKQFIGFGLVAGTIVFGLLVGPILYLEAWFFMFITHIGHYSFELNEVSPAYSEVVQRLSRLITNLLYSFAAFIALSTGAVAISIRDEFNIGAIALVSIIGWVPTTVYFFGNQRSMKQIVMSAKWKTLNRIQSEIVALHKNDITERKNIDAINRLMDYYSRVRTTPDSTLSVSTSVSFLNQLALPLIGVLIANLDKVLAILFP